MRESRERTTACVTTASRREASKWIYDIFPASPLAVLSRPKNDERAVAAAFDVALLTRPTHDASPCLMRALLRTFKQIVDFFGALARSD